MNYFEDDIIRGEKFISLADNKKIFYCHTHDVNNFFINSPKDDFILISHNSDGKITNTPKEYDADIKLMPEKLIKWYGQNVCYNHPKIESIPIGLENSQWFKHIGKVNKIINKLNEKKKIKKLLYINHNINTNYSERYEPYFLFGDKHWVTSENKSNGQDFDSYLDNIYNHKFILCPEGNGTDTHRTWECLYSNSIPIEKRNINNQFYTDLPICFVNNWNEINEDFLNKEYERITNTSWNLEKLTMKYWKKKIQYNE